MPQQGWPYFRWVVRGGLCEEVTLGSDPQNEGTAWQGVEGRALQAKT